MSTWCDWRAVRVLTACSEVEISKAMLHIPDHIAPRPPRRINYCLDCVKKLSNDLKVARQVSTITYCTRNNVNAKCTPCRIDSGNHNCVEIPPEFNRAINVLVHLQQQVAIASSSDRPGRARREERVRKYATDLKDAVASWKAAVKKDKDWAANRRASYEMNMARFLKGLGCTGELTPANQEVDSDLEQMLFHAWVKEKRWWYLRVVWFGQVD